MKLRYEIDEQSFAVKVYNDDDEHGLPFHLQEAWPDNTPWESYEQAKQWAKDLIAMMVDRKNGRPGENPATPHIAWKPEDDKPRKLPHERDLSQNE